MVAKGKSKKKVEKHGAKAAKSGGKMQKSQSSQQEQKQKPEMTTIDGARKIDAFEIPAENLTLIGLDTDHKSMSEHPLFDNRVLTVIIREEWVLDMMAHGWAGGAVTVCLEESSRGKKLVVALDGKQRIRTAREANKRLRAAGRPPVLVQCVIKKGEDADKVGSMIALNEHRVEDSVLEKARKARDYMQFNRSQKDCALRFNVTPSTISLWMKLLEADNKLLKLVDSGKLAATAALRLCSLPRDEQMPEYERLKTAGKLTIEAAEQSVFAARLDANKGESEDGKTADGKDEGSSDEPKPKKIPINAIRMICKKWTDGKLTGTAKHLSDETIQVLRVVSGDLEPRVVAGMTAALVQVGYARDEDDEESEEKTSSHPKRSNGVAGTGGAKAKKHRDSNEGDENDSDDEDEAAALSEAADEEE